jgi:transcriptional regulator with XRE-family HTH domain
LAAKTTDADNPFVEWVEARMSELGVNAAEVSRRMNKHASILANVLNRKSALGIDLANDLAPALNVSVTQLLKEAGMIPIDEMGQLSPEKVEMLRLLDDMTDDDLELILDLARERARRRKREAAKR